MARNDQDNCDCGTEYCPIDNPLPGPRPDYDLMDIAIQIFGAALAVLTVLVVIASVF